MTTRSSLLNFLGRRLSLADVATEELLDMRVEELVNEAAYDSRREATHWNRLLDAIYDGAVTRRARFRADVRRAVRRTH